MTSPDLTRVTRLAHTALGAPTQLVVVTSTSVRVLAATPRDTPLVPLRVARQLATAEGAETVTAADRTTWFGTPVPPHGRRPHVVLCTTADHPGGLARASLVDLAVLAGDVLDLELARHEVQALRDVIGTASHDLRNPLSVLRAGLETMTVSGDELSSDQFERVATLANRQAVRMSSMLDGLLSLHGLETGAATGPVDIRAIVNDVMEGERLIHRMVQLSLSQPMPEDPVEVEGVADSLARMFTNIVANAAVHGGDVVTVGVTADDERVYVRVEDDGPGMPSQTALDGGPISRGPGGHGLGLIITRRIVEDHGGAIEHRERPGGGTIVEVSLPRLPRLPG